MNLKTPGREDDEVESAPTNTNKKGKNDNRELARQYLKALGGHQNLTSIDACITRLRLSVADRDIVDEAKLKAIGAMGVVKLGENNLQVILGPLAEIIAGELKQIPEDEDLSKVALP